MSRQQVPEDSRWKQVAGFPQYWISNYQQVIHLPSARLKMPYLSPRGVRVVRLFRGKDGYSRSIQKLHDSAFREER